MFQCEDAMIDVGMCTADQYTEAEIDLINRMSNIYERTIPTSVEDADKVWGKYHVLNFIICLSLTIYFCLFIVWYQENNIITSVRVWVECIHGSKSFPTH